MSRGGEEGEEEKRGEKRGREEGRREEKREGKGKGKGKGKGGGARVMRDRGNGKRGPGAQVAFRGRKRAEKCLSAGGASTIS